METIKEYDDIMRLIMQNVINQASYTNGDIVLWDFDSDSIIDLLYFEAACMTADLFEKQIYINLPLFKYLILKWKHRKRKNLHHLSRKRADSLDCEGKTSVFIIMDFIREYLKINGSKFTDIYNEYYRGK
jgi:hypothetical protein